MDMDAEDGRKKVENARRHDAIRAMDAEAHLVKKVENARRLDAAAAIRAFDAKEERIKKVEDARRLDATAAIRAFDAKEERIKKVEDARRVDAADTIRAMDSKENLVQKVENARRLDAAAAIRAMDAEEDHIKKVENARRLDAAIIICAMNAKEDRIKKVENARRLDAIRARRRPPALKIASPKFVPPRFYRIDSSCDPRWFKHCTYKVKNIIVSTRQVEETVQQPRKRTHAATIVTPILGGKHHGQKILQELWMRQTDVAGEAGRSDEYTAIHLTHP